MLEDEWQKKLQTFMLEHPPESNFVLKFIVDPKSSFQQWKRISTESSTNQ